MTCTPTGKPGTCLCGKRVDSIHVVRGIHGTTRTGKCCCSVCSYPKIARAEAETGRQRVEAPEVAPETQGALFDAGKEHRDE